jgi:hypothetical protein
VAKPALTLRLALRLPARSATQSVPVRWAASHPLPHPSLSLPHASLVRPLSSFEPLAVERGGPCSCAVSRRESGGNFRPNHAAVRQARDRVAESCSTLNR